MKIDTTKIEGYENMTPEQKLAALEGYEYDDNKSLLSQRNAEIAKKKGEIDALNKKLAEKMTADEKAESDRAAATKALEDELKSLRRENAINRNVAKFTALGYSSDDATSTATALYDGELDTVFAAMEKHQNGFRASIEAELLSKTKMPEGKSSDKVDYDELSDKEYYEMKKKG